MERKNLNIKYCYNKKTRFNVIIAGSRTFFDYDFVKNKLDDIFLEKLPTVIIGGGAKGADFLGKVYALNRGIPYEEFLPNYDKYGKGAPLQRNKEMSWYADMLVAFWDGKSTGTKHMIDTAKKSKHIDVIVINI